MDQKFMQSEEKPVIDPSAVVAPNAVIVGNVTIGPETVISYGAVIVADGGSISIGRNTVVMEQAVIRSTPHHDCCVGNNVMVGPFSYLSGCHVEDEVFIATRASVFNGAHIHARAELRINAIVHIKTRMEEESMLPIGWVAVGDPARCFPLDKHDEIWEIQKDLNFPHTVFGVDREKKSPDSLVKQMTDKYSRFLLRLRAGRRS